MYAHTQLYLPTAVHMQVCLFNCRITTSPCFVPCNYCRFWVSVVESLSLSLLLLTSIVSISTVQRRQQQRHLMHLSPDYPVTVSIAAEQHPAVACLNRIEILYSCRVMPLHY
ncbi:unnamed protein product [Ceratitis capitata]|uniref:(Mediterranean fruit fly) hypothetical protein n=1 Tax=Ceratitis capitata TaxID=7213 RepID=A0A811VB80_CERCA|nr:unnamed protein product [Ceratitis capitata]